MTLCQIQSVPVSPQTCRETIFAECERHKLSFQLVLESKTKIVGTMDKAQNAQVLGPETDPVVWSSKQLERPQRGINAYTLLVLTIGILGGLLFGLDIGTTAITSMNTFRSEMGIPLLEKNVADSPATTDQLSLFAVLFHVFSLLGAPFAGTLADRFGRKPVILTSSIFFFAGALWQTCAGLVSQPFAWTSIILGRCVGGVGNGFILTIFPVYAAELAPGQYRGKVLTLFQFNITVGIFLMALINNFLDGVSYGWRIGFAIQCIPCLIIFFMCIFFLPESPRYLMKQNREEEARAALEHLCRGTKNATVIAKNEISDIADELAELQQIGEGTFFELFRGSALPALLCGVMVAFAQNITGVNWFMNYATQLFSSLGFEPFVWDLVLKVLNMIATLMALFFVERCGRKFLTVWGTVFTICVFLVVGLVIVGTGANVVTDTPSATYKSVQVFTLCMIFAFQVVFAITWGPLAWIVPSEVFSIRLRGKGMSCAVIANMLTNIVLGDYGYNSLYSATSLQATTLILVVLNVTIVLGTVIFLQPETKGVSLEEMRMVFGYERHGDAAKHHGTMGEFFRRNFKQSLDILRCRSVDPRIGFERFEEPLIGSNL
mmetsp:Transcript_15608/g.24415  ORF Transcript_15608/g.24415 Transcript_15608/m.24415 type:complete len:605 (+) Transcript_15608:43-1857(+)